MKKILLIFIVLAAGISCFGQSSVALVVDEGASKYTINRHIYGHFSEHLGRCIYDGYWVNESMSVPRQDRIRLDIVEALKKIRIPNLRWPGGCFADEYHWRDGIGPRNQRPTMINTNWGNVTEDNSFGTHEFLELCALLKTEPFIVGNLGSGTVEVLTSAKITDINTFDKPGNIVIAKFDGAKKQGDLLNVVLPSKSVVLLTLK